MRLTDTEITRLRQLDGKTCDNCLKTIAIDRYGISPTMVTVLKVMVNQTDTQMADKGNPHPRHIDVDNILLKHSERTQLTKMRFHALVAKVKGADGHQVARHWLVTNKGYSFLKGSEVDAKVEVYNNTVIGHVGGTTTLAAVLRADKPANDPAIVEREYIEAPAARLISGAREGRRNTKVTAEFRGTSHNRKLDKGKVYDLEISALKMGSPVEVVSPTELSYKDISAFTKDWRIKT